MDNPMKTFIPGRVCLAVDVLSMLRENQSEEDNYDSYEEQNGSKNLKAICTSTIVDFLLNKYQLSEIEKKEMGAFFSTGGTYEIREFSCINCNGTGFHNSNDCLVCGGTGILNCNLSKKDKK